MEIAPVLAIGVFEVQKSGHGFTENKRMAADRTGALGSVAAAADWGFGADPRIVEVDFHEAMQDQRRQPCYRRRFLKGGHAFGHGHRANFVEGAKQPHAIPERTAPSRIAEQVPRIGQSESGSDFSIQDDVAMIASLSRGLVDPTRPMRVLAARGINENCVLPSYDLKIGHMAFTTARQQHGKARPRGYVRVDIQQACEIAGELGSKQRRSAASDGSKRLKPQCGRSAANALQ